MFSAGGGWVSARRLASGRCWGGGGSGYGGEWDCLDWERREFETSFSSMRILAQEPARHAGQCRHLLLCPVDAPTPRTEVVWLNFRPESENRLPFRLP